MDKERNVSFEGFVGEDLIMRVEEGVKMEGVCIVGVGVEGKVEGI